jgi:hypothetical protein
LNLLTYPSFSLLLYWVSTEQDDFLFPFGESKFPSYQKAKKLLNIGSKSSPTSANVAVVHGFEIIMAINAEDSTLGDLYMAVFKECCEMVAL